MANFDIFYDTLLHKKLDSSLLSKAMKYSSLNGGKRIRPFLVMESAKIAKISSNDTFIIASSIECIHSYSLIHSYHEHKNNVLLYNCLVKIFYKVYFYKVYIL